MSHRRNAGRGVYASRSIKKRECIEVCPVVVLPRKDRFVLRTTSLLNYYFLWGAQKRKNLRTAAMCLGFGSLYNHSFNPNAVYKKDVARATITFRARRAIKKGEEITVNYNGDPLNTKDIWMKGVPTAQEELRNG